MLRIGAIGRLQRLFQRRRDLARHAEDTLTVGTVRRDGDIENPIVQTDDFADILAHQRAFVQHEQPIDFRPGIEIVVDAEFLARTEHAAGFHAAQLALFYLLHAVGVLFQHCGIGFADGGAVQSDGGLHVLEHVGRARDDLHIVTVLAAVNDADLHMIAVGMRNRGLHLPHYDAAHLFPEINKLLHFEPTGEQLPREFLRGNIDIHIIFQPA